MSTGRLAGAVLAAAVVLSGMLTAAPAADAAAATGPGGTNLVLTVRVSGSSRIGVATLRCDPPRGTHPEPARACGAVAAVGGRLTALKPATGTMCTMEYAPATASARGTWHGRAVAYRHTFPNHCLMGVQTGVVFRF